MKIIARRIVGITLVMTMLFSSVVYADAENDIGDYEETVDASTETVDAVYESEENVAELSGDYTVDTPESPDTEYDPGNYDPSIEEEPGPDYAEEIINDGTYEGRSTRTPVRSRSPRRRKEHVNSR